MSYVPVTLEFGDRPIPEGWRRSVQPLALFLPPQAFIRRVRLILHENINEAGAAELIVEVEYSNPPH